MRTTGDADGARELLRAALDLAERCGATALTPAQLRIASLAANGLGNREIAERLFLTEKTVEGHLGAAYRKLGIGSRSQIAEAFRTDPPAPA